LHNDCYHSKNEIVQGVEKLIRNQWYIILDSKEVRKNKISGITRMGEKMIAWRNTSGQVVVMSDKCPHRGVSLSLSTIQDDCIICPFHAFEYDITGSCQFIPANGRQVKPPNALRIRTYETREEHGFIYIWWGDVQTNYPPVPWFESIGPDLVFASLKDHWSIHYSRAIENQLDVIHVPFIHKTTIGRGNRTIVNGPIAIEENKWQGDHLINLWVYNEVEHGQKPLKPSELPAPSGKPSLQFRFGNIWQNWISNNIRVIIAFVPLDNENTMMYLRFYHSIKTPIIRQLFGWLGNFFNLIIERQDRRVVITQTPCRSDLEIGEILIPGDNPIILYRRIRRSLIDND
jgi:phenylpropionate dioxygenase-like ring-hydroxylating dioxygenase large terminal subunit